MTISIASKCPKPGSLSNCSLICRQFVQCPFREKKLFLYFFNMDYGCLRLRCGIKLFGSFLKLADEGVLARRLIPESLLS